MFAEFVDDMRAAHGTVILYLGAEYALKIRFHSQFLPHVSSGTIRNTLYIFSAYLSRFMIPSILFVL